MALTLGIELEQLAPRLLVNSDVEGLPLNQALAEFTRRAVAFGKVAYLTWVGHDDRDARVMHCIDQFLMVTACAFADHQSFFGCFDLENQEFEDLCKIVGDLSGQFSPRVE